MADLAAAAGKLRAFVHLSTAYVNCDRPHGSHVEEALYPFNLSACRLRGGDLNHPCKQKPLLNLKKQKPVSTGISLGVPYCWLGRSSMAPASMNWEGVIPAGSCSSSSTERETCSSSVLGSGSTAGSRNWNSWWAFSESWWGDWSIGNIFSSSKESGVKSSAGTREGGDSPPDIAGGAGGALDDVEALAAELLALPPEAAAERVSISQTWK